MADLTRRSFSSKAAACFAALGTFSGLNQTAHAQLVWKTAQWKLASFEELLGEKARIKQLFDITQVEDGTSLAKVKNSLNGRERYLNHICYGIRGSGFCKQSSRAV